MVKMPRLLGKKSNKGHTDWKEEVKLVLFPDDMISRQEIQYEFPE
jgi:hypothetical protein